MLYKLYKALKQQRDISPNALQLYAVYTLYIRIALYKYGLCQVLQGHWKVCAVAQVENLDL